MTLPSELLQAVSAPGGGKITLVVGAGCSFEPPTSIPLAGTCSEQCYRRLIDDRVIDIGDCSTPSNLSSLADAVFKKEERQKPLVDLLSQHYLFETASPNEGHLPAAALLAEGAVVSIVTLNFDLALSTAIASLGVGDSIGIVASPEELPKQKMLNLYYLHRNVTADPEDWVLRTETLSRSWKEGWEGLVAAKVLLTPIVVFVGLGSLADVLVESARLIRRAIPKGNKTYQVDPGEPDKSEFFRALALEASAFIQAGWCDFMDALSQRLLVGQITKLEESAHAMVQRESLVPEDITALVKRLKEVGLLKLGAMRANWLLHDKPYHCDLRQDRDHVADLLLAAATFARTTNTIAVPSDDGVVEFRRGDQTLHCRVFVSGRGSRNWTTIEGDLAKRARQYRRRSPTPSSAFVAATRDAGSVAISPPRDVLNGDSSESIITRQSTLPMEHVESLRLWAVHNLGGTS